MLGSEPGGRHPALRSEHKLGPKLPGSHGEKKQDMHTVIDVGLTRKSWRPGSLRYMTSSVGRICSQEGFSGTSVNPQAQFTIPAQSPSPVSIDNHRP